MTRLRVLAPGTVRVQARLSGARCTAPAASGGR